jgi:hypothetical protein
MPAKRLMKISLIERLFKGLAGDKIEYYFFFLNSQGFLIMLIDCINCLN